MSNCVHGIVCPPPSPFCGILPPHLGTSCFCLSWLPVSGLCRSFTRVDTGVWVHVSVLLWEGCTQEVSVFVHVSRCLADLLVACRSVVVHMCAVVAFCGLTLSWSAGRLIISIGWCWTINPSERSVVKEMRCGWTLTHGPLVVVWFQLSFRSIFCLTFHLRPHLPPVGSTPVSGCMFQSCCGRGAPRRFLFLSMSHGVLLTFWWPAEVWWSTCVLWSLSVGWPCHGLQAVWSSA